MERSTYTQFDITLEPELSPIKDQEGSKLHRERTYLKPVKVVFVVDEGYPLNAQIDGHRWLASGYILSGSVSTVTLKDADSDGKDIDWFPELLRQAVAIMAAQPNQRYLAGHYAGGILTITEPEKP
jgi:hypothetical protein